MKTQFKNLISSMVLLMGLVFVAGCGMDHSPTSSEPAAEQVSGNKSYLVFSFGDMVPAAKVLGRDDDDDEDDDEYDDDDGDDGYNRGHQFTQTKEIGPKGGKLRVGTKNGRGGQDDLMAELRVARKALDDEVDITMTLMYGAGEPLVIAFEPGGLVFNEAAELRIKVGKDLVEVLQTLVAYHIYDDGSVEQIRVDLSEHKDHFKFVVKVPGFSQYCLGDDTEAWGCGF